MTVKEALSEIVSLLRAQSPARDVMDVDGVAAYLNISRSMVYKLKTSYQIPFTRVGRLVMFRRKDIDKWLETNTVRFVHLRRVA